MVIDGEIGRSVKIESEKSIYCPRNGIKKRVFGYISDIILR